MNSQSLNNMTKNIAYSKNGVIATGLVVAGTYAMYKLYELYNVYRYDIIRLTGIVVKESYEVDNITCHRTVKISGFFSKTMADNNIDKYFYVLHGGIRYYPKYIYSREVLDVNEFPKIYNGVECGCRSRSTHSDGVEIAPDSGQCLDTNEEEDYEDGKINKFAVRHHPAAYVDDEEDDGNDHEGLHKKEIKKETVVADKKVRHSCPDCDKYLEGKYS